MIDDRNKQQGEQASNPEGVKNKGHLHFADWNALFREIKRQRQEDALFKEWYDKNVTPADVQFNKDCVFLRFALHEAEKCAGIQYYGVGCLISGPNVSSRGYTGELTHEHQGQIKMRHAEEVAILRAEERGISLVGATLYTTLEPCSERLSGLPSCTSRIIDAGITRVVFGAHEPYDPELKIECKGARILKEAGIEVVHLSKLEEACLASIVSKRAKR